MVKDWNAELEDARRMVVGVLDEQNPDVVAETLAEYWYQVQMKGNTPGLMLRAGAGCPPDVDTASPVRERVMDIRMRCGRAQRIPITGAACKRFPAVLQNVIVREEVGIVDSVVEYRGERAAFLGLLKDQNDHEAAREHGIGREQVRRGRGQLRRKVRAKRRAMK